MSPLQRLTLTSWRTMFSVKKSLWQLPVSPGPPIPQQELVDEEATPNYGSTTFYPAKPEGVLTEKFRLLVKIGWGSQSTVWLARDILSERLTCTIKNEMAIREKVAIKRINSNNTDDARHEQEIESHIVQQNPEHRGRAILRTCLDTFEVTSPEEKHMCLVCTNR
ncbi:serine/threonine protein kinase, putative [Talaromyces stipitatus ATCC 10500]|uniref:non-specific serine/threonine protein kinase n=1 Tax=Talaromyces stipitatus (strain ATCC 10500 / CBS 375.48 / QM 6759 / NRRL 1006) TaxID=441959 RepID=B8M2I6_TALSN|nr:serine/threonine protein kinase, putative [Talaromyces stipitatus ATCC 10500]EED21897.1 serine/threonine protein kinase, putative [Talaromyces stipitatus ATCC 10500]